MPTILLAAGEGFPGEATGIFASLRDHINNRYYLHNYLLSLLTKNE